MKVSKKPSITQSIDIQPIFYNQVDAGLTVRASQTSKMKKLDYNFTTNLRMESYRENCIRFKVV